MKNPDEAIERVLTGLREAEAPAGMEARILRAMEARAKESRDPWQGWFAGRMMLRRGQGLRLAAAVALAGVVVLTVIEAPIHTTSSVARDGRGDGVAIASSGIARTKEAIPQRLKPRDIGGVYGTAEAVPLSRTAGSMAGTKRITTSDGPVNGGPEFREATERGTDYDSLAMSEMLAPSRPAPPLPMTHQESLLAEVVHHGEPEALDQLKPEVRERQVEISKAEFHDFFEPPSSDPPPVKDNE